MSKYIKSNTTYTLRKKAQNINGGAIYERDWSTLEGQKLRFGKGKTPIYTDGNFVFTTANIRMPSRRSKPNTTEVSYTYNDVKDAKSFVNNVELNINSNDIRDFVYYGSCVNLIETSVDNIIANFPGCAYTDETKLDYLDKDANEYKIVVDENEEELYVIKNPFEIDFLTKSINPDEAYNIYRFICETYDKYEINGNEVTGYDIDYVFSKCKDDDQWYNFQEYRTTTVREAPIIITFYIKDKDSIKVIGYRYNNSLIFLTNQNPFILKPKNEVIEEYFNNLKGFEKQLLTRDTRPLYTKTFLTPIENNQDGYNYYNKKYTWPSIFGYCIDITSPTYFTYLNNLLSIATIYDDIWTNNLYNRMTHEAIKNFDWTYTKEYVEGEEQDNIDGGLRMQQILLLIGRVFDNIKQYINGIKHSNNITYNGLENLPDALLSDKAENLGWDITSVIPSTNVITLDDKYINDNNIKWFDSLSTNSCNSTLLDVKFMRNLILSSKRIWSSKGTKESIDMVMGLFGFGRDKDSEKSDYDIIEYSYKCNLNEANQNINNIKELNVKRISFADPYNDEIFSGLPIDILNIERNQYVIPFFDKNKDYGHDLYFQCNGGWGHLDNEDYCETISYLNVVTTIGALLNVSSLDVKAGDIYYVVDISEFRTQFPNNNIESHFFYFKKDRLTANMPCSWECIEPEYITDNYDDEVNDDNKEKVVYGKKAYYLNNIVNTKFGNNPHVGYGLYDDGKSYEDYISKPFKFYKEDFVNPDDSKLTENIDFKLNKEENIQFKNEEGIDITKEEKALTFNELKQILKEKHYYNNSKVIKITNKIIDNEEGSYKNYFREHMLPYLMQVIPSTTILILENF